MLASLALWLATIRLRVDVSTFRKDGDLKNEDGLKIPQLFP